MNAEDIRILYVEDVESDKILAEKELDSENIRFISVRVETREEFLAQLNEFCPDIIITDYRLPSFDGMEVIEIARKLVPHLPVIVVTGSNNEEIAVTCMKAGASDYLLKDKLKRLPFAVREALILKESVQLRQKAQLALAESEKRFKEISDVTEDFIWEVDSAGLYTYANRMSEKILGYSPDELIGQVYFYDLFLPETRETEKAQAIDVFKKKETFVGFINTALHKDGHIIILETTGLPILDDHGKLLGYRGVDRDVTERKKGEYLLKDSNELLEKKVEQRRREIDRLLKLSQEVIKNLGLAVITTSVHGVIESFNTKAENMLGYSNNEVVGLCSLELLTSKQGTNASFAIEIKSGFSNNSGYAELLHKNEPHLSYSGELEFVSRYGNRIPVQLIINALEDERGCVSGYVGVAIDIAERPRMMEALKSSEEMFRTLFMSHEAVMFLVDPITGIIEEANNSASRFYGYSFDGPEKVSIERINLMPIGDLQHEMKKAVKKQLNYFIFQHKLATGELRTVEVHSTPMFVNGKRLLFSIIHDITERKRTEELLMKSEAENRAIISTVPDLLFRISRDGVYLESYARNTLALYLPRELFIGKTVHEVLPADLAKQSMEVLKKAFDSKDIVAFEYQLPINGMPYYFENRVVAIDENEALSIIRDITDRKSVELSLSWNESLLRMMTSSSPLAFFVVDNRTDEILYFNHQFCEIWGITHLEEKMNRKELKNNDIIPDCLPVLQDVQAFAESCKPLQSEENRITIEDFIPFNNGRMIRRFSTQIRGDNDEYYGRFYIFEDITERKKAEDELQLRESYLSAVINNHPGMFWLKDSQGKFVFVNDRNDDFLNNANLTGIELPIGRTDFEFMSSSMAEQYSNEDREVIRTRKPLAVEEKIVRNNEETWYEKFKYPVFDSAGNVIGVSGYSIDITERKKTEFQLKLQQAAFESFALAMMITDYNGVIQWVNPAFTRLTGYPVDEVIGNKSSILKSGTQLNEYYENMWAELISGKVWSGELQNRRKDGSFYFEEETITPVFEEDGLISMFIAIKIDITHRKEIEEALKQSEERWQFALEGSGDGVWDWNAISNEVFFSHQWKAMLGYDDHEIKNTLEEWINRVHPEDISRCNEDLDAHFKGLTPVYINEHRILCKDGSYKWILDRGKVVEWSNDNVPRRVIGTHTDITSSKLLQERLLATIEKEKELNEMKTRFVATASHEFRTPLAAILIMSDTLLEYWKRLEEKQIAERLEKIKEQTLHLTTVVNNVLQLSRIQQGKLGYDPHAVELIQLCHQVIDSFPSDPMSSERIKFRSEIPEINIKADRSLILQALSNLISNALKYSAWNSEIQVEVIKSKSTIQIRIKDQGIGIPVEDQKYLFTPFFRASNTRLIQGNGLGLNIVRETVRLHGGDITFKSTSGKGSTFYIHLPLDLVVQGKNGL
jgi:PAS domain S-box-containing protein